MFKLLNNLGKKEIFLIIICFVLVCVQVFLELELPEYMSEVTILVETEGNNMEDILDNGLKMVGCAIFSLLIAVFAGFLTSDISAILSINIIKKIFKKVQDLDIENIEHFSTNSLITRTTNDITHIQMLVSMGLLLMIKAPVTGFLTILKILQTSWQWSIIAMIFMMIIVCTIGVIVIIVIPKFKLMQKLTDKMNGLVRENINGIRVVRAFDAENYEREKFEIINDELTDDQLLNQKSIAKKNPIIYLLTYLSVLAIYYVGAILIKNAFMVKKLISNSVFKNIQTFVK